MGAFLRWLDEHRGVRLRTHAELHAWSVGDLEGFWSAVWEHFDVRAHHPHEQVLPTGRCPAPAGSPARRSTTREHALRHDADTDRAVVLGRSHDPARRRLTAGELADQVARAGAALVQLGVRAGDRVAAYLPNVPEAVVAFLATASLGAVWAACASEFGPRSVVDRLAQVEPVVLLVAGGYRYGARDVPRTEQVAEVAAALPTVRHVVDIDYGDWRVPGPCRGPVCSPSRRGPPGLRPGPVRPPARRAVLLGHHWAHPRPSCTGMAGSWSSTEEPRPVLGHGPR